MGAIKLLTDEDFSHRAIRGVRLKLPDVDLVTVQEAGLRTASDRNILKFAAETRRVLLSHDEHTMIAAASRRVRSNLPMPGLLLAPQQTPVGRLVDAIVLIAECSHPTEWNNRIEYMPM